MQGRELAVGWEEWVDLPCLGRWPFFLGCVSCSMLSLLCPPTAGRTSPAAPRSPESHLTLQISAATGLRPAWALRGCRNWRREASPYWNAEPILSGSSSPGEGGEAVTSP